MKCKFCNKDIVLIPSASERAKRYGGKPSDYVKLFTSHPACAIEQQNKEVYALIDTLKLNSSNR